MITPTNGSNSRLNIHTYIPVGVLALDDPYHELDAVNARERVVQVGRASIYICHPSVRTILPMDVLVRTRRVAWGEAEKSTGEM